MNDYLVTLMNGQTYRFAAEDAAHAREQAENAEPDNPVDAVERLGMDILDMAVERLAEDDYNGIPAATLRERLAAIRQTVMETRLEEAADTFIAEVRDALSGWDPSDAEYGEDNAHVRP